MIADAMGELREIDPSLPLCSESGSFEKDWQRSSRGTT